MASEDDEIAQAWIEEAARRDQAMDGGEPGIPAEEVFRSIRASLHPDLSDAASYVLSKNAELYRRLA